MFGEKNIMKDLIEKSSFENQLYEYKKSNDWRSVLKLRENCPHEIAVHFLWCWPTEYCLNHFKSVLESLKINSILSVGCGTGLLEWIFKESIGEKEIKILNLSLDKSLFLGLNIVGLEVDSNWWNSKYSPEPFIPLKYLNESKTITSTFLEQTVNNGKCGSRDFALLFCYFNCKPAFREYVNAYNGKHILMIGPGNNTKRYTECSPMDPPFRENTNYQLVHFHEFGDNKDHIAIYERIN